MLHNSRTYVLVGLQFLLILVFSCSTSNEFHSSDKPEITSIEILGGSNNESFQSVVATLDGGYVALGYTQSTDGDIEQKNTEDFDFWVLKFNSENNLEWQRTLGGTNDDKGSKIIQTSDGGYVLIGSSSSNDGNLSENFGLDDFWIVKLDSNGNIVWQKSYGFQGIDRGTSIIQTNDQGFLVTGILDVTASGGEGNTSRLAQRHAGGDYWVLKLNTTGGLEWSRYFGGNFTDTAEDVIQTQEGDYIIVGGSDSADTNISNNLGSYDFWIIKITQTGDLIWEKSFGGSQIDEARAIVSSSDGNYLIIGDTRSSDQNIANNKGAADLWIIKIDANGSLIWEKTIGGSNFDVGRSIIRTQDSGFLIAGSSRSSDQDVFKNEGQNDAWIVKINDEGNLLWEQSIGGSDIDFAYSICQLNNGSIIISGDSTSNDADIPENKGFTDALIIKINE